MFAIEFKDPRDTVKATTLSVDMAGESLPLFSRNDLDVADIGNGPTELTYDKRAHLLPDAKLFVTIPTTNDRVILQRLDIDETLDNSGLDYLFVTSRAPLTATKGTTYQYEVKVRSRKGGVRYKLESGPQGMQIDADGKLSWPVPAGFTDRETNATIAVTDAAGQERTTRLS
jgi:hypothetical protein